MKQHLGWQSIFYLNVFLGCLVMLLTFMKLKGEWAGAREKVLTWEVRFCMSAV